MATVPTLKLVCESKICDLLPCDPPTKLWEASGVLVKDGHYFVVFDDRTEIARVSDDLQPNSTNGLFGMAHAVCGYEGITYNAAKGRYCLLVESRRQESGHYRALIVEYDDAFGFLKDRPVDFIFRSSDKGFEAVAHVRRDNMDYILALCEGNECQGGDKGRKPGGGHVCDADIEWGRKIGEQPYFEKEGSPHHPDDPYTVESVRSDLSGLLEQLAAGEG